MMDYLELQVPEGTSVTRALELLEVPKNLDVILAINGEVSSTERILQVGDHIDIIPAVAGGLI